MKHNGKYYVSRSTHRKALNLIKCYEQNEAQMLADLSLLRMEVQVWKNKSIEFRIKQFLNIK